MSIALKKEQYKFVVEATKKLQANQLSLNFGNIDQLGLGAPDDMGMEADDEIEDDPMADDDPMDNQ